MMKYLSQLSIILGISLCSIQLFGQNGGATCTQAVPLCANNGSPTQATNPGGIASSGACGCLASTPNPQWYVIQTAGAGNLTLNLSQTTQASGAPIDIDFILLGPITNMATACNNPCQLPVASCSYSTAANETITAANVQPGQTFLLLVTNFNGQPSNINIANNGAVPTNCAVGNANNGGPYCEGQTISLTAGLPIGANPAGFTFSWTGPNGFSANTQNATIPNSTVANGGVYSLTLTQNSTGNTNTYTTTVVMKPKPNAALTATSQICLGDVATFNASASTPAGINTYQWIFNNSGVINQTTPVPNTQYTYPAAGIYNTGVITTLNGCKDTANFQVTVSPKPTAAFTMAAQGCENKAVTLNGSTSTVPAPGLIVEYQWDYNNDGNQDELTTTPMAMHAFAIGNHTVKLTVRTNGGCTATTTKTIEIIGYPQISFDFNNACVGGVTQFTNTSTVASPYTISYNWDFGVAGGYPSTLTNPSFVYPGLGTYNVSLEATANNLCKDTLTRELIISNDVTAGFSFNEPCNLTGIYTDESLIPNGASGTINGWGWSFGDGGTSTDQNATHDYLLGNIYNVTLIVSSTEGCFDTLTQAVPKYPVPVAAFSAANVCQNFTTEFIDSSTISSGIIQSWAWSFGSGDSSSQSTPTYIYDTTGTYNITLSVVSEFGCSDTAYGTTEVYPYPTAAFTTVPPATTTLLEPEVLFVETSTGAESWLWTVGNSGTSNNQKPIWTFEATGTYLIHLLVTNEFGCTDEAKREFIVTPAYNFFAPNAFTPFNGDAVNEYWRVYTMGLKTMTLRIYNRWGEQLYATQDPLFLWDGTYNGKRLPVDVYIYKADVRDMEGKQHEYYGSILILE